MTPILESQATKKKEHLEVVKVNVDENQGIASQLRIQSIPAVFAFSDGQPVDGFMGAKTEPEVEKFLDTLIKKFQKIIRIYLKSLKYYFQKEGLRR